MGEAVVATLGEWALAAGAADAGAALIMYSAEIAAGLQAAAAVGTLYSTHKRARDRARAQAAAAMSDRYVMRRGTTEPRQLVLGRDRVSGPWAFFRTHGAYKDHFVMVVALASHEIDAVERVYFDDEPVVLDGSGNVIGIQREEVFAISSASATFELTSAPKAGTVSAVAMYGTTAVSLAVSVLGTSVTVGGASSTDTGNCIITYQPKVCPWVPRETTTREDTFAVTSATQSFTLATPPVAGSVSCIQSDRGVSDPEWFVATEWSVAFTVSGATLTVTGATPGRTLYVKYQAQSNVSRARVRPFLGTDTQTADAALQALLPGVWTSNHRLRGTAGLVVEFDYDENALSGGIPNVSAVIRGMKGVDPRTGSTVWSDNQALMTLFYAKHPLGGRRSAAQIDEASFIAAANACDASTAYTVGGKTYTRALYKGGCMVTTADRPDKVLDDLVLGMAGDWCIVNNRLRVKAGAWRTPVPRVLDRTWLAEGPQQYQARPKRTQIANVYTGSFNDESQHLREVDFPRVPATTDAYITEDNGELVAPLQLSAVQFVGQAQHIASVKRREVRGALLSLTCNLQAIELEPYDIIPVELADYGLAAATDFFEVLTTSWNLAGGITLALRKVGTSTYVPTSDYRAVPLSPPSRTPSPLDLPDITGLAASSGTDQLLRQTDGTLVSRIRASWSAVADARITQEGQIELRWGRATTAETTWESVFLPGRETETWLLPVQDGATYILKARVIGTLAAGDWCAHVVHVAQGKAAPPATPTGLVATVRAGAVEVGVTPSTEVDYGETEVRIDGADWAAATRIYRGSAFSFLWPWPTLGAHTLRVKHFDTSGNESGEATLAVTIAAADLQVGTVELEAAAATFVDTVAFSGVTVTGLIGTPFGSHATLATYSYTPDFTGVLTLTLSGHYSWATPASGTAGIDDIIEVITRLQVTTLAAASRAVQFDQKVGFSASGGGVIAHTARFNVTAGTPYTINALAQKGTSTQTVVGEAGELRLEGIKR